MPRQRTNIVLIGMPGSGKSTVGALLAKRSGKGFVDTDLLIQRDTGQTLQQIIDAAGHRELRRAEATVLANLDVQDHVIATGGSAVYSASGMEHLRTDSLVVFLDASLGTVRARLGDFSLRGIAKRPEQTLEELFRERYALYERYADQTIHCEGLSQEAVCERILHITQPLS